LRESTGEIEEIFKESEDRYIRIHGMDIKIWLRCEIIHQRGQGKGKMGL
jgi:ribulose bisphosphate carboxylase small subunit